MFRTHYFPLKFYVKIVELVKITFSLKLKIVFENGESYAITGVETASTDEEDCKTTDF